MHENPSTRENNTEVLLPYEEKVRNGFVEREKLKLADEMRNCIPKNEWNYGYQRRTLEVADSYYMRITQLAKEKLTQLQAADNNHIQKLFLNDPANLYESSNYFGQEVLLLLCREIGAHIEKFVFSGNSPLNSEEKQQLQLLIENHLKTVGQNKLAKLLTLFSEQPSAVTISDLFADDEFANLLKFIITAPPETQMLSNTDFIALRAKKTKSVYESDLPLIRHLTWHRNYLLVGLQRKKIRIISSLQGKLREAKTEHKIEDTLKQELEVMGLAINNSPVIKDTRGKQEFLTKAKLVGANAPQIQALEQLLEQDPNKMWEEERNSFEMASIIELTHDLKEAFKDVPHPLRKYGDSRDAKSLYAPGEFDEYNIGAYYAFLESMVDNLIQEEGAVKFRENLRKLERELMRYLETLKQAQPDYEKYGEDNPRFVKTAERLAIKNNLASHIEAVEKLRENCQAKIDSLSEGIKEALQKYKLFQAEQRLSIPIQELDGMEIGDDGEIVLKVRR